MFELYDNVRNIERYKKIFFRTLPLNSFCWNHLEKKMAKDLMLSAEQQHCLGGQEPIDCHSHVNEVEHILPSAVRRANNYQRWTLIICIRTLFPHDLCIGQIQRIDFSMYSSARPSFVH